MSTAGDDRALEAAPAVLTSPDGLVRATVGSGGTLGRLEFAPDTFQRTTPAQLAFTVQALVQQLAEAPLTDAAPQQMPSPRPTPRRVRPRTASAPQSPSTQSPATQGAVKPQGPLPPRSAVPQHRRRGY
ncbi:hypothetical protein QRX50_08285 [Amycolatopsis carbonis]|uniref:Uncharacterized protein n=1 Tax=Amycolatopsis carbonis TaxID=715471 RepID=A0A9Y2ILE2_9PSEU|nr:hypothetical protein [Amycolatopsis sp. 2-15]WIX80748.1 hypothetical protein QRX50_08285 [Amycolatopsis sp. 2-15]